MKKLNKTHMGARREGSGDLGSFEACKAEKHREKPLWEGAVLSPCHIPVCLPFCSGLPRHTRMTVLAGATNEGLWL